MFHSLRWRIAIPYVLLIVLCMLGLGIYLSNVIRQNYLDHLEAQLTTAARLIGDAARPALGNNPDIPALDALAKHDARMLGMRVTIIALNGTVVGESDEDRALMDNHLNRPEVAQALAQGLGSKTRLSTTLQIPMLYLAIPVPVDPEASNPNDPVSGIVRIALPLKQVEANIAQLRNILITATLLVTGLAIILATLIASRTTRPVRQLTQAVQQMASGELPVQSVHSSLDEIGQLTQAFNIMSIKLGDQINALETERGKLSAVLQKMTDGVIIADADGHIQLVNPAAEYMFSISQVNSMGRSLAEVTRQHQVVDMWQQSYSTGEWKNASFEVSNKKFYLQGIATPLGPALAGSTLLLFQDITRQRQIETMRRDFISNISHELRTPVAALKALTETLQDGALEDPPAARRFLERMETEVDSLSLIVTELLELMRIESGRVPVDLKPTSPVDIVLPAAERLSLQVERANLILTVDCPDTIPPILADASRIQQVVVNLLHNAIKFTPQGGQITISAAQQPQAVLFSVKDTGMGISPEDLPRIFERFYKVDRSRASSGTGLGLAIALYIVEAHAGKIWAESEVNQGSTFYFTIPLA